MEREKEIYMVKEKEVQNYESSVPLDGIYISTRV